MENIENENLNIDNLKGTIPAKDIKLEAISKSSYKTVSSAGIIARESIHDHKDSLSVYVKSSNSNPSEVFQELESVIYQETSDPTQGDYMLWNIDNTEATFNRSKAGSTYYFTFKLNVKYLMTVSEEKELLSKADEIISSLGVLNEKTEYKKIKSIYDYVCKNVVYYNGSGNMKYSTYGALINHKSVCQGYASAVYLLSRKAGLSVRLIPGVAIASGEQHGWNIVKIGKVYYNLDSTWDANLLQQGKSYGYFLKGDYFEGHARWDTYATPEFYSLYPMSANPYSPNDTVVLSDNSKKAVFEIIKPKWKKVTRKKASIKKVSGAKGYQLKYSTKSNFKKKFTKTVTIKKTKYKFKKLKKGKNYYTKFRAYKYFGKKKAYTKWSKRKKI